MGKPQFAISGTDGGGQTVATQSRPEIAEVTRTQNGSLASGAAETIEVYAPSGGIYRLKSLKLSVSNDSDATSGTHSFGLDTVGNVALTSARATYDTGLKFQWSHWKSANDYQFPATESAQLAAVQSAMATENQPIRVQYNNNTDVTQEETRFISFVFEEEGY